MVVVGGDHAGEDDGHGGAGAGAFAAGAFAHDADAVVLGVFEVLEELGLGVLDLLGEGGVPGALEGQEGDGGEVADELVDLGVGGGSVQEGQVDGEAWLLRPQAQDVGVGGEQDRGGGQGVGSGVGFDGLPVGLGQAAVAVGELGAAELGGLDGQGQGGGGG